MPSVSIFREGKGTQTTLSFKSGKGQVAITKPGAGRFLESRFATVAEAEAFCQAELKKDPSTIFLLFADDVYASTVIDRDYHTRKSERGERIFGLASVVFFSAFGLIMSLALFPDHNVVAHAVFALSVGIFSIVPREFMGRGNFEGAIVMGMLLLLLWLGIANLHEMQKRRLAARREPVPGGTK